MPIREVALQGLSILALALSLLGTLLQMLVGL